MNGVQIGKKCHKCHNCHHVATPIPRPTCCHRINLAGAIDVLGTRADNQSITSGATDNATDCPHGILNPARLAGIPAKNARCYRQHSMDMQRRAVLPGSAPGRSTRTTPAGQHPAGPWHTDPQTMIAPTMTPKTEHTYPTPHPRPRRGAPIGSANAVRHGLRAAKCPPGCSYIDAAARELRKAITGELLERGELTLYREALIQSCLRHEVRAQLAGRWLRVAYDTLDAEKRLALLAAISKATDDRDRCLARMGLDRSAFEAGTLTAAFYSEPLPSLTDDAPASPQTPAPAAGPRDSTPHATSHPGAASERTEDASPAPTSQE